MQQNNFRNSANNSDICKELINAVHKNDLKRVKDLLDAGADVDGRWDHWQSPLMRAVQDKNQAMVLFLLSRNAPVNVSDMWGYTPLIYAAINGSLPIVRILLDHKADVNQGGGAGTTALIGACGYGYTRIADLLLKAGARINMAQAGNGMTALMQAVHDRKHECIKLLLGKGADKSIKNRWGGTALSMARENHDAKSITLLR